MISIQSLYHSVKKKGRAWDGGKNLAREQRDGRCIPKAPVELEIVPLAHLISVLQVKI